MRSIIWIAIALAGMELNLVAAEGITKDSLASASGGNMRTGGAVGRGNEGNRSEGGAGSRIDARGTGHN